MWKNHHFAAKRKMAFSGSNAVRARVCITTSGMNQIILKTLMWIFLLLSAAALMPSPARSDTLLPELVSTQTPSLALIAGSPPHQPTMVSPIAGEMSIELAPSLMASPFADDDENDRHISSHWRIDSTDDGRQALDIISDNSHLIDLPIPIHILDPTRTYTAQVRYFDANDHPSPWSDPLVFTTGPDPYDTNENHIPDSQELSAHVDLNQDGKNDTDQGNMITSIKTHDGRFRVGFSAENSDTDIQITAAASINPYHLPEPFYSPEEMAFGLLAVKIELPHPGMNAIVTIYLSEPIEPGTPWLRYDSVQGWEEVTGEIQIDAQGYAITRYLTDGGIGDADGTVNGIIIDKSGPLTVNDAAISDANDHASSGSDRTMCFIHTVNKFSE